MKFKSVIPTLVFILLAFLANAQSEEEIKEAFWGAEDPQKTNMTVQEKWKNESAVILYKEHFYDYHKFTKNVKYSHSIRKRIKLQDQAAVKEHSEFSFSKKFWVKRGYGRKGVNHIGVKIVKPDGTEKEIQIDEEAVKTDDEFKLAISGLEIGDILDYYIYTIEPFVQNLGYEFEPMTRILSDEYPVAEMVMKFNTENDFFINFNSYNGAPELQEVPTDARNDRRYILKAQNIEKRDFPMWYYPQIELPYYKFQVTFARKGHHADDVFNYLSENEAIIKKQVTKEEVKELYQKNWGQTYSLKNLEKHLKEMELTDKEKVVEAYHYIRHHFLTYYVEKIVFVETKLIPAHTIGGGSLAMNNTALMATFLNQNEIPFNRMVAVPRYSGKISDLLYRKEATEFLEVPFDDGALYIPALNFHSDINSIDYTLEGTDAYALKYTDGKSKITDVELKKVRGTSYTENGTKTTTIVSLNEDFDGMKIQKTSNSFGHTKASTQEDVLMYFDYTEEDRNKYETTSFIDGSIRMKKNQERVRNEANALISKLKTRQSEYLEKQLENELEFEVEDYNVNIEDTGRYGAEKPFVLSETFTMPDNFVKKAGRNYLLEIGKFIGGQISLDEDEKLRTNNIYMAFPRSFENTIEFNIPEGYDIGGIDKLNTKVENETGGFVSSAEVVDGVLKIHTNKYYKNYYEPNINWTKMVDFLEAAHQFTQVKVMLKKEEGTTK